MAKSILDKYLTADKQPRVTRFRAIRLKCLDCCGNQQGEVSACAAHSCPLWPLRAGKGYEKMPQGDWDAVSKSSQKAPPCPGKRAAGMI
jgi:hypothetical protein